MDEMPRFKPPAWKVVTPIAAVVLIYFGTVFALSFAFTGLDYAPAPSKSLEEAVEEPIFEECREGEQSAQNPARSIVASMGLPFDFSEEALTVPVQTVIVTAVTAEDNGVLFGTGFVLRPGTVVTAAHVLVDASSDEVTVVCSLGGVVRGKVILLDAVRDVALVAVRGCGEKSLALDPTPLKVEDELHITGFSFGPVPGTAARYHAFTSYVPGASLEQVRKEIRGEAADRQIAEMRRQGVPLPLGVCGARYPGNSGSPVFRGDGQVVGMLIITDVLHNRSFIVSAASIQKVLDEADGKKAEPAAKPKRTRKRPAKQRRK